MVKIVKSSELGTECWLPQRVCGGRCDRVFVCKIRCPKVVAAEIAYLKGQAEKERRRINAKIAALKDKAKTINQEKIRQLEEGK